MRKSMAVICGVWGSILSECMDALESHAALRGSGGICSSMDGTKHLVLREKVYSKCMRVSYYTDGQ